MQFSSADSNKSAASNDNEYTSESPKKKQQRDSYDTPAKATLGSNSLNSSFSSPMDPTAKIDRDARSLNLILESALLCTLRRDSTTDNTIYLGDYIESNGNLLNSTNISEVVCSRLTSSSDRLSAMIYLTNSYKRLVAKETAAPTQIQAEINK